MSKKASAGYTVDPVTSDNVSKVPGTKGKTNTPNYPPGPPGTRENYEVPGSSSKRTRKGYE